MEILNRKASFDYEIKDTYEAGIVLLGTEIKSVRKGNANLKESFITIKNDEAYILNMHISHYEKGNVFNHEETRTRKLLLNKKEILRLKDAKNIEGQTIIPLKLYFKNNRAKILIAIAKGKKLYDKREAIKKKDTEREMASTLKHLNK